MNFTRALFITASLCATPVLAVAQTTSGAAQPPSLTPPSQVALPGVSPSDTTPVTKGELPEMVRQVLLNNPNIMVEVAKKMHEAEDAQSEKDAKDALEKNKEQIFSDASSPTIGNEKSADITLVEFFDYHCGYCHQMLPVMVKLVGEDKKIRVIFKEYPILSEDSVTAARAALAVWKINKDKYFDFHQALMQAQGKFDQVTLLDIAQKQGIDSTRLKLEMDKPEITAELDNNRRLGEALGIHGTPALILNDQILPGAMSYEELKKVIGYKRAGKTPDGRPAAN